MTTAKPELPYNVAETLRTLRDTRDPLLPGYIMALRDRGWPTTKIGIAAGMTRQRVSQLETAARRDGVPPVEHLPLPPEVVRGSENRRPDLVLDMATRSQLLGLLTMAGKVRHATPADHPNRVAGERLNRLVVDLLRRGVPLSRIAFDIGVDERTLRARLARYGITPATARQESA